MAFWQPESFLFGFRFAFRLTCLNKLKNCVPTKKTYFWSFLACQFRWQVACCMHFCFDFRIAFSSSLKIRKNNKWHKKCFNLVIFDSFQSFLVSDRMDRASAAETVNSGLIPGQVKPKTIKNDSYSFPAWRSVIKWTVWSLHSVW